MQECVRGQALQLLTDCPAVEARARGEKIGVGVWGGGRGRGSQERKGVCVGGEG